MNDKNIPRLRLILLLLIIFFFLLYTCRLGDMQKEQGRLQLEHAVRKTAVTCYAVEGFYPPDIAYMQEHYGLQWNSRNYMIHYEIFASNLMPDITVLTR